MCSTTARASSFEENSVRNTAAETSMVAPCRQPVTHQSAETSAMPITVLAMLTAASRRLARDLEPGAPWPAKAGAVSWRAEATRDVSGRAGQAAAARRILVSSSSPLREEGIGSGIGSSPGRAPAAVAGGRSPARRLSTTSKRSARSVLLTCRRRPCVVTNPEITWSVRAPTRPISATRPRWRASPPAVEKAVRASEAKAKTSPARRRSRASRSSCRARGVSNAVTSVEDRTPSSVQRSRSTSVVFAEAVGPDAGSSINRTAV